MADEVAIQTEAPVEKRTRTAGVDVRGKFKAVAEVLGLRFTEDFRDAGGCYVANIAGGEFAAVRILNDKGVTELVFPELGYMKAAPLIQAYNAILGAVPHVRAMLQTPAAGTN